MGLNHELTDVDRGFGLIASFPQFHHLPIILSEADPEGCAACSSRMNPANNYRNGTLYPAYTAAALKALFELQDRHAVNLISMLSWSFEFEDKDYFEGFRSLATNGIDKPILNLFRMLGLMSGDRVRVTSTGQVPLDTLLATGVRGAPSQISDVDALATRDFHLRRRAPLELRRCRHRPAIEANDNFRSRNTRRRPPCTAPAFPHR